MIKYLITTSIVSISVYSEARLIISNNNKEIEIIYSTKKSSEIRKINEKTKKLNYWYIEDRNTQLEIKKTSDHSVFFLKKYSKNYVKKITGVIHNKTVKILSSRIEKSKIYFNECITNRFDMNEWLKSLQSKMSFENDYCNFSNNCPNDIRIQFVDFFRDEDKLSKVERALACTLPESNTVKLILPKIANGTIQISCAPAEKSVFKAFYFKNEDNEIINLDPKLFRNESDLIESLGHEIFHAAGTEDESKVKEYTSQFMSELKKPSPSCKNRPSEEKEWEQKKFTAAAANSAQNTKDQTTAPLSTTPITTNPDTARRVSLELEQPVSASTLASLSTPSGREQYIAATEPARRAALSWANDVVRAVGDTVIPTAHAGTLAGSGSTSTKTRGIASVNGTDSSVLTTSSSAKLNTSSNSVTTTEQKTKKGESTSSNPIPNEVATKTYTKPTSTSNSRNIASVNSASGARVSGSSSTGASGSVNNGTSNRLNQKNGTSSTASSDIVSFIQNTDYHIVKEELNDKDFLDRLRKEGVKIITLDGKVFGDKNGRVKFSDRGHTFVKEGR